MTIKEGAKIPDFKLIDQDGDAVSAKTLKGRTTVLFFYPKDSTPGCTVEAKGFSKTISSFKRRRIQVYGVSGGTTASKEKFCASAKLTVPLLSDIDFSVSTAFGVYGEKKFMGRTYNGIKRTTIVLDPNGRVTKIFENVKPEGHAEEVLDFLTTGAKQPSQKASKLIAKSAPRSLRKSPRASSPRR